MYARGITPETSVSKKCILDIKSVLVMTPRMIFKAILFSIAVLATSIANLYAQNSDAAANAIQDAFRQAGAMARPIPEAEQKKAYEAASTILQRLVTFNEDGTAKTIHHWNGNRIHLEWSGLQLGQVSRRIVTDADILNGITNRYAVAITSKSHRRWDSAQNRWTEWIGAGYPLFPSSITLIEKKRGNGTFNDLAW